MDLSNNEIEDFEGNFSAVLDDLDSLFLNDNDIQSLPADMVDIFDELDNLTLRNNPLHCNCEVSKPFNSHTGTPLNSLCPPHGKGFVNLL